MSIAWGFAHGMPLAVASAMALNLEATVSATEGGGWRIRLPVRREAITVHKRTVVVEEVEIRRELVHETMQVQADTRHEVLDTRWHERADEAHVADTERLRGPRGGGSGEVGGEQLG